MLSLPQVLRIHSVPTASGSHYAVSQSPCRIVGINCLSNIVVLWNASCNVSGPLPATIYFFKIGRVLLQI